MKKKDFEKLVNNRKTTLEGILAESDTVDEVTGFLLLAKAINHLCSFTSFLQACTNYSFPIQKAYEDFPVYAALHDLAARVEELEAGLEDEGQQTDSENEINTLIYNLPYVQISEENRKMTERSFRENATKKRDQYIQIQEKGIVVVFFEIIEKLINNYRIVQWDEISKHTPSSEQINEYNNQLYKIFFLYLNVIGYFST